MMPTCNVNDYIRAVSPVGILMTGGNDLSTVAPHRLNTQRDHFESQVLCAGIDQGIPIFAVCRGTQFIAHQFGLSITKEVGHNGRAHHFQSGS